MPIDPELRELERKLRKLAAELRGVNRDIEGQGEIVNELPVDETDYPPGTYF